MDVDYLEGINLFKTLKPEERQAVCTVSHSFLACREGQKIIQEGEKGGALFVLLKGSARVTKGEGEQETVMAKLVQGDTFGEMSFLTKKLRSTNVIADEPSLVLKMDEHLFDNIASGVSSKIKDQIIDMLVQRLDKMNQTMAMLIRFAPVKT